MLKKIDAELTEAHAELFDLEFPDAAEREVRRKRDAREWKARIEREAHELEKQRRATHAVHVRPTDAFWDSLESGPADQLPAAIRTPHTSRQGKKFLKQVQEEAAKSQALKAKEAQKKVQDQNPSDPQVLTVTVVNDDVPPEPTPPVTQV